MEIRNVAIIAHVDHGKTTLVDALLTQRGLREEGVSMDSNALEQERGITIYAKNTSLYYKDTKINIVDTPGHADFGSEVERVLRSIDSVILLVDAQEGPMPQTRFVLKKSLELGFKPIVVLNKIDKPAADVKRVHDEVLELFFELGATEEQIEFPMLYAIGKDGVAKKSMTDTAVNLDPLLDTILEHVPAQKPTEGPAVLQVFNLAYDNYLGRMGICRMYQGTLKTTDSAYLLHPHRSESSKGSITKMFGFEGFGRNEITQAETGDIIMLAGFPDIQIGDTISTDENTHPLDAIKIDEPTISMKFLVNDSPFAGRDGKFVTSRHIKERIERELEVNVGLKADFSQADYTEVFGRGELHVSILVERMRREGYELQISQPEVVIHKEGDVTLEPYEEVIIETPAESASKIIEALSMRKGIMMHMSEKEGINRLTFEIPTRGLLGYREEFIIDTRGEGIISSRFIEFRPHAGPIRKHAHGAMISAETGKAIGYALYNLQNRGMLYVGAGDEVYTGQVIGNTAKGDDLYVNPIKGKQLTNMRASGSDENIMLVPPYRLSVERAMELMTDDEYTEITPTSVRLRKKYLTKSDRDRANRKTQKAGAEMHKAI